MSVGTLALGIVELAGVCARQRAINLSLFETLGALATSPATGPGADQQLFAIASHRHAWHAELWAQRAPALPADAFNVSVDTHHRALADASGVTDVTSYRAATGRLISELTDLRNRFDPLCDPSTDRVIELVLADLERIQRVQRL